MDSPQPLQLVVREGRRAGTSRCQRREGRRHAHVHLSVALPLLVSSPSSLSNLCWPKAPVWANQEQPMRASTDDHLDHERATQSSRKLVERIFLDHITKKPCKLNRALWGSVVSVGGSCGDSLYCNCGDQLWGFVIIAGASCGDQWYLWGQLSASVVLGIGGSCGFQL